MVAVTLDDPESRSLMGVGYVHLRVGEATRRVAVQRSGPGRKGQVLLQLEGTTTPEAAEALRDQEILLEPDQLPPLEEGEYWQRDILQLVAVDEAGRELGPVAEVVDTADVPVLVVRAEGGEIFVPFVDPYVLSVDMPAGRIVVAPPEMAE